MAETPWWTDVIVSKCGQVKDDQLAAAAVAAHDWTRDIDHAPNGQFISVDGTPVDRSHRSRNLLAQQVGVSKFKIERARKIQRFSADLLKAVGLGEMTAAQALAMVHTPATPPDPDSAPQPTRRQIIAAAHKERMVKGLSLVNGLCRGLLNLKPEELRGQCSISETQEWGYIARSAARILSQFARELTNEAK